MKLLRGKHWKPVTVGGNFAVRFVSVRRCSVPKVAAALPAVRPCGLLLSTCQSQFVAREKARRKVGLPSGSLLQPASAIVPQTEAENTVCAVLVLAGVAVCTTKLFWLRRRLLAGARQAAVFEILTKWFSLTRLETRTKESNIYASIWVSKTLVRNESEGRLVRLR